MDAHGKFGENERSLPSFITIPSTMPELRNSNVNGDNFYSSAEILEYVASCTESVYNKPQINWHASANATWYLCFLVEWKLTAKAEVSCKMYKF